MSIGGPALQFVLDARPGPVTCQDSILHHGTCMVFVADIRVGAYTFTHT